VEATQLIGTLGGIGELAREALSIEDAKAPRPPKSKSSGGGSIAGITGLPRTEE